MGLQKKIRIYTQNHLVISVQSEQLTRLKEYVTAFLTAARNEHSGNTQLTIYFSYIQAPGRWRNRAICLCVISLV